MTTFRIATPPAPPADWAERLMEYQQVKNLINGDTVIVGGDTPTSRLMEFMSDPAIRLAWYTFNSGRPRL